METATITIRHTSGLHARPLATFVQLAKSFNADIRVENLTTHKGPINGKSPLHLLTLAAQQGHEVRISADGPQGAAALAALLQLIERDFAPAHEQEL